MGWGPWQSVSSGSTTPGAPVNVVAEGNGFFSLFVADPNGGVYTARGNAEAGWGPWQSVSSGSTTPGAPVNVVAEGNGFFSLFVADPNGGVYTARGNAEAGWGPWQSVSSGSTTPGAPVNVVAEGNGFFSLFVADPNGGVYTARGNAEAGWGPWQSVSSGSTTPGAPVNVVAEGNGFFSLFVADPNGGVYTARGNAEAGWGPWQSVSSGSTTPGAPVNVVAEGNGFFSLFVADPNGGVYTARGNAEAGWGPWQSVSSGSTTPGAPVNVVAEGNGFFSLFVADPNGGVYTARGNAEAGWGPWQSVSSGSTTPGAPVNVVAEGNGFFSLFVADPNGGVFTTTNDPAAPIPIQVMTTFTTGEHGWHFDNLFVNELLGGRITTQGLCGGMAYTSLDYYFAGIPIPTHRMGDFGDSPCPPDGRLHSMIYSRLIDSFKDNFGKWSCVYPELDGAVGAALGLVVGAVSGGVLGGVLGGIVGAVDGLIYGELHEVFSCPGGGPAGMTRQELPHLIKDYLAKGVPAPIGLIYDDNITNIGWSHQVVAHGYAVAGGQTLIYIYDNRLHGQNCMLTIDTENPGKILQTLADGSALPNDDKGNTVDGTWEGLLVSDGYQKQVPSYGQDIGIASPQALTLSGPVVMAPIAAGPDLAARMYRRSAPAASPPVGAVPIVFAAQPQQLAGSQLIDSFAVQNYGEYQAHFQSLGIEIDSPDGNVSYSQAAAAEPDNLLPPGQTLTVTIDVDNFGDEPGAYAITAGYNTVPLANAESSEWLMFIYPSAAVMVK